MNAVPQISAQSQRPWFLNPGVIFYSVWLGVWFLYSLRLSSVLLFPFKTVAALEIPLLGGFLPFLMITWVLPLRRSRALSLASALDAGTLLRRRLEFWLKFWIGTTVVEIVVSGGIPIVWTLTGSSKDYFQFGIPTVHGLMNALILAISIARFTLGLRSGRNKDLLFPMYLMAWAVVVETRQMIILVAVECTILYLMYRKIRIKQIFGLLAVVTFFVVLFGIAGDVRTGGEAFRKLAQPTDRYPEWLPSGFLWVYIYMTTPLNNLINTWVSVRPLGDITLPNTLSQLVPTAVRNLIGHKGSITTWTGELVTEAFNVSTAFVGPVQDLGTFGVFGFSAFAATASGLCWVQRGLRSNLIFAVLGECLLLSIFFNHFFFLPIIAQVAWFYIFFWQRKPRSSAPAATTASFVSEL